MKLLIFVIYLLVVTSYAKSQDRPVPQREATPSARVWLARACVGESGWYGLDDCKATFYVYARRWKAVNRHRYISFEDMVRAYSAPLRPTIRHPNRRQRMIRSLPYGDIEGRYREQWAKIRAMVDDWFNGQIEDPCHGDAIHFGSATDHASSRWVRIDCGSSMHNRFYAMRNYE